MLKSYHTCFPMWSCTQRMLKLKQLHLKEYSSLSIGIPTVSFRAMARWSFLQTRAQISCSVFFFFSPQEMNSLTTCLTRDPLMKWCNAHAHRSQDLLLNPVTGHQYGFVNFFHHFLSLSPSGIFLPGLLGGLTKIMYLKCSAFNNHNK